MTRTESDNPIATYFDKYVLGNHEYEHIHHVKHPITGTVLVLNGTQEIELIVPKGQVVTSNRW